MEKVGGRREKSGIVQGQQGSQRGRFGGRKVGEGGVFDRHVIKTAERRK